MDYTIVKYDFGSDASEYCVHEVIRDGDKMYVMPSPVDMVEESLSDLIIMLESALAATNKKILTEQEAFGLEPPDDCDEDMDEDIEDLVDIFNRGY